MGDAEKTKGRFDDFSVEVIVPIMQKMYEVAFESIESIIGESNEIISIPLGVKDGVLETLDEIISYCIERAGTSDGASLIGFALGRDGMKPGRQFRSMQKIATALRDLIEAKDEQIKQEIAGTREYAERERVANMLGL